jgi:hypothetical protein
MPILTQKLKKTVPLLLSRPSLLAHTIYQAISFDASMVEEGFHLGGTSALKPGTDAKWDGIGEVILGNPEWFEAWLTAEKRCTSLSIMFSVLTHLTHSRGEPVSRCR